MKKLNLVLLLLMAVTMVGIPGASAAVDYSTTIQPIFTASCNLAGCHPTSGVDLSNWSSVTSSKFGGTPIVTAGDAANSILFQAVNGSTGAIKMPIGGSLTTAQIQSIADWINEGAMSATPTPMPTSEVTPTPTPMSKVTPTPTPMSEVTPTPTPMSEVTPTPTPMSGATLTLTLNTTADGTSTPLVNNITSAVLLDTAGVTIETATLPDDMTAQFGLSGITPGDYFIEVNDHAGALVPTRIDSSTSNIVQDVGLRLRNSFIGSVSNPTYRIKSYPSEIASSHPVVNFATGENESKYAYVIVSGSTSKIEVRVLGTDEELSNFSTSLTTHDGLTVPFQTWILGDVKDSTGVFIGNHGHLGNATVNTACIGCHVSLDTKPATFPPITGVGQTGWCFRCHNGPGGPSKGFVDPAVVTPTPTPTSAVTPTPMPTATGQPVVIMPTNGPNVDSVSKTLLPPAGSDAASSIGLGVQYSSFVAGNPYNQYITDSNGAIVPGTNSSGGLSTGNDFVPIHWTPSSADIGNKFTVHAEGRTTDGQRLTIDTETAPAQPVPVEAGVLGGFMVTAGLLSRKLKKKN